MATEVSRLADAADRRAIQEDLSTNILVEAAAGTGKTTQLVARMVALVASGRATVERISAVTFTLKAAGQLRERFQVALEQAAAGERDDERRRRLNAALSGLSNCFVGTIHSFCARLLRERPVEAGVEPGFEELDDAANVVARDAAWDRYAERLFVQESPVLARLTELGVELQILKGAYAAVAENRDVRPCAAAELPAPDLSEARAATEEFLARAEKEIPTERPTKGWDELAGPLRDALRLRTVLDLTRGAELVKVLEMIRRAKKPEPGSWPDPTRAKELWDACRGFQESWVRPALRRWQEYLHPILMSVIVPAAEEFDAWRKQEGQLSFQDLLLCARDLLRDFPDVRRAFRERFTPILVDEFQDTDPIQAEVLLYLTGNEVHEKDWRGLTPMPGALFVVGDPKQSIYRFRRADIETYARVRSRIRETGGRILHLTTNFRSDANICDWVNEVFASRMPVETEEQPAYAPLHAWRPAEGEGSGVFRLDLPADSKTSAEDIARADAERIAGFIQASLSGRPTRSYPSDYLILLRYRKHMREYARALERRGIPYEIAGGGAFKEAREIQALLPFLKALADPDDSVARVAALRGALFGVDDAALHRFHAAGGSFSLRAGLAPGSDERIAAAYAAFRRAEKLVEELPPGAAIARICADLGWTVHAAAGELGETRAGNLLKLVTAARQYSARGEGFGAVVERLSAMAEEGDAEEMSTQPGRREAVQLMTLHKAKGLEANVVFLADPWSRRDPGPKSWVDRGTNPPEGHFLICRSGRDYQSYEIARPLGWEEKVERERRFEEAEKERLLYVAVTRPAHMLVVSIRRERDAKGKISDKGTWKTLGPWLRQHLPEPVPAEPPTPPPPLRDLQRDLAAFTERRQMRQAASRLPSYAVTQVTRLAHASAEAGKLPFAEDTGHGMAWGRVLHRLLEAAMKDADLDVRAYAANLLAEEDPLTGDLEEAVRVAEAVRGSELWRRALRAKRRLVEVPFALTVPSDDLGISEGPPETLLHGAIDLLFEEDDGWVIVDYKSDTVAGNLEELVRFYRPQLAHYKRQWETLTGKPARAALYFIQPARLDWLPEN